MFCNVRECVYVWALNKWGMQGSVQPALGVLVVERLQSICIHEDIFSFFYSAVYLREIGSIL